MSTLEAQTPISRDSDAKGTNEDFVILCPAAELDAALSALYYLPHNYKLVIRDRADHSALASMLQDDAYMNRVSFEESTTGTSNQDASAFFANAVLQNDKEPQGLGERIAHRISLHDAATPEALASAILKAARA
jgi:hypothetical protein